MRLVGYDKDNSGTFDARVQDEVCGKRIFEFDLNRKDYMLKYHLNWEEVVGEYIIEVKGKRYTIPSGMYIFCGDLNGSTDWILVDEIINRDIMVFVMNTEFGDYNIENVSFRGKTDVHLFLPATSSPLPVADLTGNQCIIMSRHDMFHKMQEFEYDALFIS